MSLIKKANRVFLENFDKKVYFERAIFLSWYCSKDCKFCYMPTQKTTKKSKRTKESILAEAYLSKKLKWKIEFLSSGYNSLDFNELFNITKEVYNITKEKQWLNVGILNKKELKNLKPYIKGVNGSVETINPEIHKKVCPSKPVEPIIEMFNNLNLKKSITIIIGLGETIKDFNLLKKFIEENKIDRVTFYALNPHKNTIFKKGPETEYYVSWIAKTRIEFPKLEIIAGSWVNRLNEINLLLKAGANSLTKFPSIKLFNTKYAKKFENEVKKADRGFIGSMTNLPKISLDNLDKNIQIKLKQYLNKMNRN